MLLLVLSLMIFIVLVVVFALVLVFWLVLIFKIMFKILFMIMFMMMFVMMLTRAIVLRNLMCTKKGKCWCVCLCNVCVGGRVFVQGCGGGMCSVL